MEQSSSRLYSGHLSQAAKKILAVLRAQSLQAGRRNHSYSYNHRPSQLEQRHNTSYLSMLQYGWLLSIGIKCRVLL